MKMADAVGLDMSKETFDARIHSNQLARQFKNTNAGFKQLIRWVSRSGLNVAEVRFCAENTGLYSHALLEFMAASELHLSLVPALQIKRSLGITRGKEDQLDAKRIAQFAYLRREILEDSVPLSPALQALKKLIRLRKKLVRDEQGYTVATTEAARVLMKKDHPVYFKSQQVMAKAAKKQLAAVEKAIEQLIQSDEDLWAMNRLLQSVIGIGPVIAAYLIAYTDGFTRFSSWRKFASYIGIAPFPHSSGTSIQGRSRVSHLANKQIKSLFFMAASTAIQHDPQLKLYYENRLKLGKSEMSSLNAVKNKILARAFAVIRRQTPYVKLLAYAA
jgi:transposase